MREQPFVVAVISPNRKTQDIISEALQGHPDVEALRTIEEYPSPAQLGEIGNGPRGCIVFLDFAENTKAMRVAAEIERSFPKAAMVALHDATNPHDVIELMRIGIREIIQLPMQPPEVVKVFGRLARKLLGPSNAAAGDLYAFLPAKPGAGASTLAVHCASAAARLSGERFLLMDLDFRLGMTSFLLRLHEDSSVLKALTFVGRADQEPDFWETTVGRRGMLDILGSASATYGAFDPEHNVVELVHQARRRYRSVFVDLPGEMRDYETELLTEAKECFVVCTPDLGTLHIAKRKALALAEMGVRANISVIMNKVEGRGAMSTKDLEGILGLPVRFTVSANVKEIVGATQEGRAMEGRSALANQIENIGRHLAVTKAPIASPKKRFLEFFSIIK